MLVQVSYDLVGLGRSGDVEVSSPMLSQDHNFGFGVSLTVVSLGLHIGLVQFWSYELVLGPKW